jgi:hypothetical protein
MTSPERNRAEYREPILDTHMAGPFPILGIPNSAVIGKTTVPPTDRRPAPPSTPRPQNCRALICRRQSEKDAF